MNKLKSTDQHAPLQFVSPYAPKLCRYRLFRDFRDSDDEVIFIKIDDTLTEFHIKYREGSTQLVVNGTLRSWAAGEQTRIMCRVEHLNSEINQRMPIFYLARRELILMVVVVFGFVIIPDFEDFLLWGGSWLIFYIAVNKIVGSGTGLYTLFSTFFDPPQETSLTERVSAKAESRLYDRLVALLSEPEPLYRYDRNVEVEDENRQVMLERNHEKIQRK